MRQPGVKEMLTIYYVNKEGISQAVDVIDEAKEIGQVIINLLANSFKIICITVKGVRK